MSYIPDCRTHEYYNQRYLTGYNKNFIAGYDCAVENIELFFANLDTYHRDMEISGEDLNLITYLNNHEKVAEKFMECFKDWLESQRDEIITAFIDDMAEDEYEETKRRVDSEE